MNKLLLLLATILVTYSAPNLHAQVNFTANDMVTPYEGLFRPGINKGFRPPYSDEELANIAAGYLPDNISGLGAKTLRPALYGNFVENFGYDFHLGTYDHYENIGLDELTCIVGFPSQDQREQTEYCPGFQSAMFANLYTDIWDDGENGTPYNDENYFAAYLYEVVSRYKDHVRFWEIWNEPGFDLNGNVGFREPGDPIGNWWDNDPNPCDNILRAPIQSYIRTLRIAYDVIKTIDPDAYVAIAGVGFPSFLDAILRNTDNPNGGAVTPEYPNRGGAYFDVMGFHSYPDIDGSVRRFNPQISDFDYFRHSDAAAQGVFSRQAGYREVLERYGYGTTLPEKEWIITEINVPRKAFGVNNMGSEELQRNYILKALVTAQQAGAHQMQVYTLSDQTTEEAAGGEFDLLGLYKAIQGTQPYDALEKTQTGIAYKTGSDQLYGARYDAQQTAAMAMPSTVDGAAFRRADGSYVYTVWAKTTIDRSEEASATYNIPASLGDEFFMYKWDYSETNEETTVAQGPINLDATPIYLSATPSTGNILQANFTVESREGCTPFQVRFNDRSRGGAESLSWSFEGGTPAVSTARNPIVTFETAGLHKIQLVAAKGNQLDTFYSEVSVDTKPTYQISTVVEDLTVKLAAFIDGQIFEKWIFEDGSELAGPNQIVTFDEPGTYNITFFAGNACGNISEEFSVTVPSGEIGSGGGSEQAVNANFSSDISEGCTGLEVNFTDQSTGGNVTSRLWAFPGGSPATSTTANPTVTYRTPGIYQVSLVVSNSQFNDQITRTEFIEIKGAPTVNFASSINQNTVKFESDFNNADSLFWDFGDGNTSQLFNPTHIFAETGQYTITLTAKNDCDETTISKNITITSGTTPTETLIALFEVNSRSVCAGSEVTYTSTSTGNPTGYEWTFPGGTPSTSTEQSPTIRYNESGTFDATLNVIGAQGTNTLNKNTYVSVFDEPNAQFDFTANNLKISFENNSNAGSYTWDFGDGNTSALKNPIHTYETPGDYDVTLVTENVCGQDSTSLQLTANMSTSVDNLTFVDTWLLYPNPTQNTLNVTLEGTPSKDPMSIKIINIIGKTVIQEGLENFKGSYEASYDVGHLPSGIYLMEIKSSNETGFQKFIKQ